jgi:DNA-binding transcriptional MerR regulator
MSGMSVLGDITPNLPSDMSEGGLGEGGPEATARRKSPNAFRTISEVAEDLHIPLKRGGGRRYYRPEDITLLRRIGDLLYTQGYTIKGVQRLLREGGIEAVEAAGEGDEPTQDTGNEGAELRACLAELEAISAELRALSEPRS